MNDPIEELRTCLHQAMHAAESGIVDGEKQSTIINAIVEALQLSNCLDEEDVVS